MLCKIDGDACFANRGRARYNNQVFRIRVNGSKVKIPQI
jgi:hypothetical protein